MPVELSRDERLEVPRVWLWIAGIAAVIAAASIATIDQPVARTIAVYEPSPVWDGGIEYLEWLLGLPIDRMAKPYLMLLPYLLVGGMIVTAAVPRLRRAAPAFMFLAGTHLVSRFAMVHLKDLTGRLRPNEWLKQGGDTFWRDGGISFPSGHVVLFASVVFPLVVLFPRLRPLVVIPVFAMAARLFGNAHFISDVVGGIAVCALVTWGVGWLVRPLAHRTD